MKSGHQTDQISKEPTDFQRVSFSLGGERGSQTYGFLEYHKIPQFGIRKFSKKLVI